MERLQNAHVWEAVGLFIFLGVLIWLKVPGMALAALDARGAKIQAQLDEAQKLRQEAENLLAQIKVQREETERQAAAMLAAARADADRLRAEAKVALEAQIVRRGQMAERRIALAESQAAAEVKAAAADLAAQAAEAVLSARLAGAKTDPLVDQAISQLASKLQ
ncbi:MAG: F0F1 ATP synthase subunit B [Caulobacterales bacterium]